MFESNLGLFCKLYFWLRSINTTYSEGLGGNVSSETTSVVERGMMVNQLC